MKKLHEVPTKHCFAKHTINHQISPLWAYIIFGLLHGGFFEEGGLFEGSLKIILVVCLTPVEIFLLIDCFFDAIHTSNRVFFKGHAYFR